MASVQATAPDPTSVYRYYDARGMLIYVGITKQGIGRNYQHNAKAEWWQYVVRQDVEHYPTRLAAAKREKELIRQFRPPFNRQHNLEHEELRAAYTNYQDREVTAADPLKLYKLLGKTLPVARAGHSGTDLHLMTYPQHQPLARLLRITTAVVPLCLDKGRGRVLRVDASGPIAHLYCRYNGDATVIGGEARVALKMELGKPYARLDLITLKVAA